MNVAVMQPYFLPYLGYFQLLGACDTFVVYDDVNFIKQGWIHRNRSWQRGEAQLFSLPVKDASQNRLIRDHRLSEDPKSRRKLLASFQHTYAKAPCFGEVFPVLEEILGDPETDLTSFLMSALLRMAALLGLRPTLRRSSQIEKPAELAGQDKILAICRALGATRYLNPIGGTELYDARRFREAGIELRFLRPRLDPYPQFPGYEFVPGLSIVDVLMFNPPVERARLLAAYELVEND